MVIDYIKTLDYIFKIGWGEHNPSPPHHLFRARKALADRVS